MAITWNVEIKNVDVAKKRADVFFTRTDDVTGEQENYNFKKTVIETSQQRLDLLDLVWQKHLDEVADQTATDNFISNLQQLGKANLEAREA